MNPPPPPSENSLITHYKYGRKRYVDLSNIRELKKIRTDLLIAIDQYYSNAVFEILDYMTFKDITLMDINLDGEECLVHVMEKGSLASNNTLDTLTYFLHKITSDDNISDLPVSMINDIFTDIFVVLNHNEITPDSPVQVFLFLRALLLFVKYHVPTTEQFITNINKIETTIDQMYRSNPEFEPEPNNPKNLYFTIKNLLTEIEAIYSSYDNDDQAGGKSKKRTRSTKRRRTVYKRRRTVYKRRRTRLTKRQ